MEADAPARLALRRALFAETDFLLWEPAEFKNTSEDERARIARLTSEPNSLCLVAQSSSQLVGFLDAMGGQVNRQRHSTTLALAVLRAHWGSGIASGLLAEVLAWSKQVGIARVELTCTLPTVVPSPFICALAFRSRARGAVRSLYRVNTLMSTSCPSFGRPNPCDVSRRQARLAFAAPDALQRLRWNTHPGELKR
jgi:GNAT superfamily N-acetyltransferase